MGCWDRETLLVTALACILPATVGSLSGYNVLVRLCLPTCSLVIGLESQLAEPKRGSWEQNRPQVAVSLVRTDSQRQLQ